MIGLLTVLGALLLGTRAQQQEFRLVGSDVTLVPKYTGEVREITWLLNDRTLVDLILKPQEEIMYNFTNYRATINKANGALTIRNLTIWDSGDYEAHVILMEKYIQVTEIRLTVRDCPDQPTISVESTKDWFVVFCKSFSPDVTYEWFNQTTSVSKNQSYTEPKKNVILTCVVDNEVCNRRSSINFYTPAQPEVKSVGDNVTLVPQYTGDPSEIIWKVNSKLGKMVLKPSVNFTFLQDRATISHTDRRLTIRNLTMEDSGDYTALVLVNNEYYYTEIRLTVLVQQQEFRLVGSNVTLVPQYTGDLKQIEWKLNDKVLVEIILKPEEKTLIDNTNERTTINKANGALTIKYLTKGDSGVYKVEVVLMDDSFQVTDIRLTVRDCPDQPTISVESTEDQFELSCKSVSPDITYEWFNPTTSVRKSPFYAEPKKDGTLTCVVGNEVCNKSSSINFYIPEVKSVGDDVILVPQYTGDPSEIIWKVNGNNLVKMELKPRVDFIFYRLKDRANISHTDGNLTIWNLTMEDSGDYEAVVLVNNEYYYTEIRLEPSRLSGVIIALIVCGVLSFIAIMIDFIIFLWYYYYKKSSPLSGGVITGKVFGVLSLIALIFLLCYYYYKKYSRLSGWIIALIVFGGLSFIALIILLCYYHNKYRRETSSTQLETRTSQTQDIGGAEENDDHTVENENAAPSAPAGDGNIDGVKGDKNEDVEKGIPLVPKSKNVDGVCGRDVTTPTGWSLGKECEHFTGWNIWKE